MNQHRATAFALSRRVFLARAGLLAAGSAILPQRVLARTVAEQFPNVTAMVDSYVKSRKVPGMLAALGSGGGPPETIVRGVQGFNDPDPLTVDTLFRIYSMTKPVTGMAAMILIDEGKLGLDQPLADILPGYARMQVQVTPDGSLTEVRPAKTAITIRHLLTHTAGLAYGVVQKGPLRDALIARGLMAGRVSRIPIPGIDMGEPAPSLEVFADRLAGLPLVYEPGTRWSYSLGLDVMGRVIEVVAGQPFDAYLRKRILEPAGMTSTYFTVPKREAHRLATNYVIVAGLPIPVDTGETSIFIEAPEMPLGGAGLVSSPRDYDRFLHMLAGYGRIEGKRVMSERAVRLGTSNLLPPGAIVRSSLVGKDGFGAGGRVGLGENAGRFGWGGAAGTIAFVDLARGLRAGLYTQFMPANAYPVHRDFPLAVASDLRVASAQPQVRG